MTARTSFIMSPSSCFQITLIISASWFFFSFSYYYSSPHFYYNRRTFRSHYTPSLMLGSLTPLFSPPLSND